MKYTEKYPCPMNFTIVAMEPFKIAHTSHGIQKQYLMLDAPQ